MLRAVTFDLGDTLIDYGPMDYGSMLRQGLKASLQYVASLPGVAAPDESLFARRVGRAVRSTWYRSKLLIEDRNVETRLFPALEAIGVRLEDESSRREFVRRLFAALTCKTRAMPGVTEALSHVASRGLAMAVVSNTVIPPWLLDESLEAVGLLGFFPRRYYSCALGVKKPARRMFAPVLHDLGVEPGQVLHVGDRYLTDVWGARRAGLRSCLIVGHRSLPIPPVRPDFRIRHMRDLPPIVDRLLGLPLP
jgi:putative hydrolase of the HAD superfamily